VRERFLKPVCIDITIPPTLKASSYVCVAFALVVPLFVSFPLMFGYPLPFNPFSLLCTCTCMCILFQVGFTCFFQHPSPYLLDSQPLRIFLDDVCFFFPSFCNTCVFFKKSKRLKSSYSFFFFVKTYLYSLFIKSLYTSTSHILSSDINTP